MLGVTKVMDVSREGLAKLVGVSTATVSRWEDDLRRPKPDAMHKLADVLGVSPAWLDYGVEVARPAESDRSERGSAVAEGDEGDSGGEGPRTAARSPIIPRPRVSAGKAGAKAKRASGDR